MKCLEMMSRSGKSRKMRLQLIEDLAYNSENPSFKTQRFRKALINFRRYGMRPPQKAQWTAGDAVYYARHSHHIHLAMKHVESVG